MICLFFVGDGARDEATVPPLVRTILQIDFSTLFQPWARLHAAERRGRPGRRLRGYGRKLLYAIRAARVAQADGLVATVDRDKAPGGRLGRLREARAADRQQAPSLPTALGEAKPHAEAWLLDDPAAVREALELPGNAPIPSVRQSRHPKDTLHGLWERSPRREAGPEEREIAVLQDIARRVDSTRCAHRRETGFQGFVTEVRRELGGLAGD